MTEMNLDPSAMRSIQRGWTQADHALGSIAGQVGDSSGDWAPGVQGAVTSFANAWRNDIRQLAAEAAATSANLGSAISIVTLTDEESAAMMARIQAARPDES
jgi:hypothetical protein